MHTRSQAGSEGLEFNEIIKVTLSSNNDYEERRWCFLPFAILQEEKAGLSDIIFIVAICYATYTDKLLLTICV